TTASVALSRLPPLGPRHRRCLRFFGGAPGAFRVILEGMERLRREVLVPLPTHRRPTSLIGLSIALVLLASAVDAVVWSFQAQRAMVERQTREMLRYSMSRHQAAAMRLAAEPPLPAPARIQPAPTLQPFPR